MSMLAFSKMHGLGNDFVVIDALTQTCPPLTVSQRQWLADRHRGIGCDQILLVEAATQADVDFKYRIFNADGGEVSQCGNGARCFARFVTEKGLTNKDEIVVETLSGVITLLVKQQGEMITVDMGRPVWTPELIPFQAEQQQRPYSLTLPSNEIIEIDAVSMGNPHAVTWVDDIVTANIAKWGPMIEGHARFPERVNAGFAEIVDRQQLKLRVYERGVGETQACGTGACAAAVVGIQQGLLDNRVMVHLTGGTLQIEWQGQDEPVLMTGSASHVFDGELAWATITAQ